MITENKEFDKKETQEPFRFKKRHGSTTFLVAIYSNLNAKETAQDKIVRLIRNDSALGEYGATEAERRYAFEK